MRSISLIPLATLLIAAGDPRPDDSIQGHDPRLVGTWQIMSTEKSTGRGVFWQEPKMTITFSTTRMVFQYQNTRLESAYTTNPNASPCWIDTDVPCRGIYAVEGKTLRLFIPNSVKRPRNFKDFNDQGDTCFILERQK